MSVGFSFGIRHSYLANARESARALHEAVNAVLARRGLAPVADPEANPHPRGGRPGRLGRSSLDHHSAGALKRLGALAGQSRPHLQLLQLNPYRVVFVPRPLRVPQSTSHREQIWNQTIAINVGSPSALVQELLDVAQALGIPLANGVMADEVARTIDDLQPLADGDSPELIEDLRTAWLGLHETARFSIDLDVPLALAG